MSFLCRPAMARFQVLLDKEIFSDFPVKVV